MTHEPLSQNVFFKIQQKIGVLTKRRKRIESLWIYFPFHFIPHCNPAHCNPGQSRHLDESLPLATCLNNTPLVLSPSQIKVESINTKIETQKYKNTNKEVTILNKNQNKIWTSHCRWQLDSRIHLSPSQRKPKWKAEIK